MSSGKNLVHLIFFLNFLFFRFLRLDHDEDAHAAGSLNNQQLFRVAMRCPFRFPLREDSRLFYCREVRHGGHSQRQALCNASLIVISSSFCTTRRRSRMCVFEEDDDPVSLAFAPVTRTEAYSLTCVCHLSRYCGTTP